MRLLAISIAALAGALVAAASEAPPNLPAPSDSTSMDSTLVATIHPDTIAARIARCARDATHLDPQTRTFHDELLDAARELAAERDFEAAAIVLEDARALTKPAER